MRDALLSFAIAGETVLIDTRTGMISAEKIMCRTTFAEILNPFGDYFIVDYADIRDMRSASTLQTSAVNANGDWVVAPETVSHTGTSRVLRFPGRSRRT